MSMPPANFDPTASLLQDNPSATIGVMRGGGLPPGGFDPTASLLQDNPSASIGVMRGGDGEKVTGVLERLGINREGLEIEDEVEIEKQLQDPMCSIGQGIGVILSSRCSAVPKLFSAILDKKIKEMNSQVQEDVEDKEHNLEESIQPEIKEEVNNNALSTIAVIENDNRTKKEFKKDVTVNVNHNSLNVIHNNRKLEDFVENEISNTSSTSGFGEEETNMNLELAQSPPVAPEVPASPPEVPVSPAEPVETNEEENNNESTEEFGARSEKQELNNTNNELRRINESLQEESSSPSPRPFTPQYTEPIPQRFTTNSPWLTTGGRRIRKTIRKSKMKKAKSRRVSKN